MKLFSFFFPNKDLKYGLFYFAGTFTIHGSNEFHALDDVKQTPPNPHHPEPLQHPVGGQPQHDDAQQQQQLHFQLECVHKFHVYDSIDAKHESPIDEFNQYLEEKPASSTYNTFRKCNGAKRRRRLPGREPSRTRVLGN